MILNQFNNSYANKPCFIIGSGTSINSQDLLPIKDHISIAVNSGFLATPWSNFFLSDDWSVKYWSYFYRDLRKSNDTLVLLYESNFNCEDWPANRIVYFKHRQGYNITDVYNHYNNDYHICEARTSVGSAIHVAHIMGCNPIILIGIDCCRVDGKRYFWTDNPNIEKPTLTKPNRPYRKVLEKTLNDGDLKEITDYWNMSAKYFLEKCNIINASPISSLECFPKKSLTDIYRDIS